MVIQDENGSAGKEQVNFEDLKQAYQKSLGASRNSMINGAFSDNPKEY